jgi:hypothetical protein
MYGLCTQPLNYVKQTKATYHDRCPMNDQIRGWKAHEPHAWKYSRKAQQEVWDMRAREHDNQQPLIAERLIESLQTNALKWYGAVYVLIIQGDNAGPHQEWEFDASCKAYCHTRGAIEIPRHPKCPMQTTWT